MKILSLRDSLLTGAILPLLQSQWACAAELETDTPSSDRTADPIPQALSASDSDFTRFLGIFCSGVDFRDSIDNLKAPTSVDFSRREISYQTCREDGATGDAAINFYDFKSYYDFAFSSQLHAASMLFYIPTLSDLLKNIQGAVTICTPEYLRGEDTVIYQNVSYFMADISDYSDYNKMSEHHVPVWFFHRVLLLMYPDFSLLPIPDADENGEGDTGSVRYLVTRSGTNSTNRSGLMYFDVQEAFLFYACGVSKLDQSVADCFSNMNVQADYMRLMPH